MNRYPSNATVRPELGLHAPSSLITKLCSFSRRRKQAQGLGSYGQKSGFTRLQASSSCHCTSSQGSQPGGVTCTTSQSKLRVSAMPEKRSSQTEKAVGPCCLSTAEHTGETESRDRVDDIRISRSLGSRELFDTKLPAT